MKSMLEREPVVVINAFIAVIEAGIVLGVAFGLQLNPQQIGAIMSFVVAITTLLRVFLVRTQVTPVAAPQDNAGQRLVPENPSKDDLPPAAAPGQAVPSMGHGF